MTKLTKKEKFAMVLDVLQGHPMLSEFIQAEIDMLENKSAKASERKASTAGKPSEIQIETYGVIAEAAEPLNRDEIVRVLEMLNYNDGKPLTVSRITAACTALIKVGKIEKVMVNKKTAYQVAK